MVLRDRRIGLFVLLALAPLVSGVGSAGESAATFASAAPLNNPHTLNLELDYYAKRRGRGGSRTLETSALLDPAPELQPFTWPRNSDLRARLLTPQLRDTPVFGWIASNLYRSKRENGWCLEVDPGEGEYLVFYRKHLR